MIKIGTDCSGIEAPIQALTQMGIKFKHLFSSEINKFARKSILANYSPDVLYEDMTKPRELPKLDIYVCGFPCQPFSLAGKRLGSSDPRSNIFLHCVQTIVKCCPSLFILENVPGIMSCNSGEYFKSIRISLSQLTDYNIDYQILNTKDYGIPQNRKRLFIIGTLKPLKKIGVPERVVCPDIDSYIDKTCTEQVEYCESYKKREHLFRDCSFVNIGLIYPGSNSPVNPLLCPTLNTNRIWCHAMRRKATNGECLSLQGFPTNFKQVVSDTQMARQIGNSMSVNVLIAIFKQYFSLNG